MRRMTTLATIVSTSLLLAACGGGDDGGDAAGGGDEQTTTDGGTAAEGGGSITIAFANEVPYGYQGPDGEPTGQAPEVAKVVLEELGYDEVDAQVVSFEALINGLNAGQYDMIAAGMFINEERASQALFSDPDYCGTTAFAVPEGNPEGLTDFESVTDAGVTLGVLSGAVEDEYAVSSGVPEDQIQRFPETADLVDALTSGVIDAFALTTPTVVAQTAEVDGFEASEGFVPVIDGEEQLGCGGYVFRFEDKDLRDQFNEVLVEMRENDEILPIIEEFGFTQADVDAAKGVTVEDLIGQPYDFAMQGDGS